MEDLMRASLLALLLLCSGCEDNEHPFEDSWSMSCSAEGAPSMTARFNKDNHVDDGGRKREYVGRVDIELPNGLQDVWIWQVKVNLVRETAETVELVRVPIPEAYVDEYDLQTLTLEPDTFVEVDDTTSADMTGTCSYGDVSGVLTMRQSDDCDVCDAIDCSTLGLLPGGLVLLPVVLGYRRRKRRVKGS
ncbi:MAG: hypothetical protein ACI9MC_003021 [Kiritimatiellia bacterium]